ncbi:endo-1,4-beta-xylanase [Paraburkholderia caballeronis]|uniref:Beta-xylanase n=1 Tax=Paraburkholderia caballeronis TaxID=416943 RepID=A0A1H7FVA1_9BURK|nr:endo-1,4-beta-xylanase [Paraburkholderia caballeronis]PXW24912.1 endo-1,4-beta-xylanase [Paraburkholderia caballeronis]PXX00642.1 endo-1,4-beta-xylanase [Paraburkholderia caballeronis]RAJ98705.1 endo-1,4-beta-xylanase [Paraburkholderia caballeronis]TDV35674.1 endo-1,4-beta-xylanase [Paraburkholderia caballeronis]SEE70605.1 endo-1,4-beta-xylanase [Paraburkholderia caballeronis]
MPTPRFRRRQICIAAALLPVTWVAGCASGGVAGGARPGDTPLAPAPRADVPALKTVMAAHFKVGAAVEPDALRQPADAALIAQQFSSLTAENKMKPGTIGIAEGRYNFGPADEIVAFAQANGIAMRGHTLVWHFQAGDWKEAPDWFFAGDRNAPGYRDQVAARLHRYVTDVVAHFRGKVYAWDVVNEVISDDPAYVYRQDSPWFKALGKDYIAIALRAARAADPDVKLYINDYNTDDPGKRARLLSVIRELQAQHVPIDGVGHQMHVNVAWPPLANIQQAFADVVALGLENQVTELDVSFYNDPGSCWSDAKTCLPDLGAPVPNHVQRAQALRYRELFDLFEREPSIRAVTFWGYTDGHTWLSTVPAKRTNQPLLFDADLKPKAAFWAIVEPAYQP